MAATSKREHIPVASLFENILYSPVKLRFNPDIDINCKLMMGICLGIGPMSIPLKIRQNPLARLSGNDVTRWRFKIVIYSRTIHPIYAFDSSLEREYLLHILIQHKFT